MNKLRHLEMWFDCGEKTIPTTRGVAKPYVGNWDVPFVTYEGFKIPATALVDFLVPFPPAEWTRLFLT